MNRLNFKVKTVTWESAKRDIKPIRETVFIQEQNVPAELEWDGLDRESIHILAILEDNTPIGTVRLLPDGHIGRMAVLRDYRNMGVGSAMLSALLEHARKHNINDLFLLAQTKAISFYKQYGFSTIGEIFMDAGIPHKKMIYSQVKSDTGNKMSGQDENTSTETDQVINFETRHENRELTVKLATQAKHTLRILTHDLESAIYDNAAFIQTVTQLVTRSRHSKVHILVKNPSQAIINGHRLIELSRKFSSYIHLHNPSKEDKDFLNAFIIADESGYLYRQKASRNEGAANFHGPFRARELGETFDDLWGRSLPDPEMRRLYI